RRGWAFGGRQFQSEALLLRGGGRRGSCRGRRGSIHGVLRAALGGRQHERRPQDDDDGEDRCIPLPARQVAPEGAQRPLARGGRAVGRGRPVGRGGRGLDRRVRWFLRGSGGQAGRGGSARVVRREQGPEGKCPVPRRFRRGRIRGGRNWRLLGQRRG